MSKINKLIPQDSTTSFEITIIKQRTFTMSQVKSSVSSRRQNKFWESYNGLKTEIKTQTTNHLGSTRHFIKPTIQNEYAENIICDLLALHSQRIQPSLDIVGYLYERDCISINNLITHDHADMIIHLKQGGSIENLKLDFFLINKKCCRIFI